MLFVLLLSWIISLYFTSVCLKCSRFDFDRVCEGWNMSKRDSGIGQQKMSDFENMTMDSFAKGTIIHLQL